MSTIHRSTVEGSYSRQTRPQGSGRDGAPLGRLELRRSFALLVGNTAFGGTFTSRLVDEIREKRGWSYGVSSSIFAGRTSGTLMMRFFPENRDLAPAIELVEKLFSSTAFGGLSADEVDAARKYLIRQYPFRIETVRKRADELVAELVFGRPAGVMSRFVELVSSQDGQAVNQSRAPLQAGRPFYGSCRDGGGNQAGSGRAGRCRFR